MPKFYEAFGMRVMGAQGYEADDFIATLVKKFKDEYTILIASSDKDLMQLICEGVLMIDPTKDVMIDEAAVVAKFGVKPNQIGDYLSLIGDASDNIPGARSVGPKTAIRILQYGMLDAIVANTEIVTDKKLRQVVLANLDSIILSQKLVMLTDDIEITIDSQELVIVLANQAEALYKLFGEYSLQVLQKRVEKYFSATAGNEVELPVGTYDAKENRGVEDAILRSGRVSIALVDSRLMIAAGGRLYKVEFVLGLKEILESQSVKKIAYDAASLEKWLRDKGVALAGIYDLSTIYYHLMGVKANTSLVDVLYFCGLDDFAGKLDNQKSGYLLAFDELYDRGIQSLFQNGHLIFLEEDRRVYRILRQMEREGILIDREALKDLGGYFETILLEKKEKIVDLTGYDFNILSPKQTSEVLFDKLELKPGKKSKNEGVFSTNHNVLEDLAEEGVEAAEHILQYRSLYKLKSSYCESLAGEINLETGRIHTSFTLNGATTGRILSAHPNLQNTPTKNEEGRKIRGCFIARNGHILVSADYSQIELRILAHIAGVKNLLTAFDNDDDIHSLTASQVFRVPLSKIDSFWRSKAKAVNFGIIYGISAFGLSKQLKISMSEADGIIKNYLACYSEIHQYLEKTKEFASKFGFVETAFGRRCNLRLGSKSMNYHEKQFLERAAINAPIQGTASDVIKIAMIKVADFIEDENLNTKILLQIHDELIFEVPDEEATVFNYKVQEIMEGIGRKIGLKLKVEINNGKSWMDL